MCAVLLVALLRARAPASPKGLAPAAVAEGDDPFPAGALEPVAREVEGRESALVPAVAETTPAYADHPVPAADDASIEVLVRAREDGAPLAGVRLVLLADDPASPRDLEDVDGPLGSPSRRPRTDATGLASFVAPARTACRVLTVGSPANGYSSAEVEPLEPGARRRVELSVASRPDRALVGDDASG